MVAGILQAPAPAKCGNAALGEFSWFQRPVQRHKQGVASSGSEDPTTLKYCAHCELTRSQVCSPLHTT